ncbi:MAG: hypothetical protein ACI4EA_08090 [Candidatus Ornithomonoglobus sp.]
MNIIASTSKQPYTKFVTEMLNTLEQYNVRGIAVVVLADNENLSGYWNMNLYDKSRAKNEIEFDCMDEFIKTNIDRYIDHYNEIEGDGA